MNIENANKDARKLRNEYYRDWRKKNPEKVAAANRRYWERKVAEAAEKSRSESDAGPLPCSETGGSNAGTR